MSERPRRRESARPPSTPSRRAFLLSRLGRERGYFFNVEEGTDGFLLLGGYGKTGSRQRCGTSLCRTCSTRSSRPRRSGTTTSTRASLALLGPLAPFYLFVRPGDLPKLPLQNHHIPHGPPLAGPEGARKRQVKANKGARGEIGKKAANSLEQTRACIFCHTSAVLVRPSHRLGSRASVILSWGKDITDAMRKRESLDL